MERACEGRPQVFVLRREADQSVWSKNVPEYNIIPWIDVSVASLITAATASSVFAKSSPRALNCAPVDWIKLSGRIGVAMNLRRGDQSAKTLSP